MRKVILLLLAAVLLLAGTAGALAETREGIRTAGAKWPYIVGGIAAIAIGIFLCIGMVSNGSGREVLVTPTFIPIPMPLIPAILGVVIGIALFTQTPKDMYVLGGVQYSLGEKAAAAVGFAKDAEPPEALALPAEVDGVPLTTVGRNAFSGASIRELILPASIQTIGKEAFRDCTALERVTFAGKEQTQQQLSVGDEAFRGCTALQSVQLPENVKELGRSVFMDCAALQEMAFAGNTIGSGCFAGCSSLRSVSMRLKSVPDSAFKGCSSLVIANMGEAESIGDSAFEGCASLICVSALYADSYGGSAFANCPELVAVGVGYNVKSLPKNILDGSPKAVLYTGSGKTREKAEASRLRFGEDRFFACDFLPDGTLRLTDWRWGEDKGVFTVPAAWCGLPVSSVALYRSTGQANARYVYKHEEIVVQDGILQLEDDCFLNWEGEVKRLYLPQSIASIGKDIIGIFKHRDITLVTANELAAQYAAGYKWQVVTPDEAI
ncbi:MAG: leucine-rich repeat protein [Clostridia bacterium]|nr:leucine-rich repeat protein [Clostridia bacterium]